MPMTKKGLLPNAYRFIHIAADGFEDRILKGRLYHDSREGGMPFIGLSEMILILEELFDEIHYPIKSVDYRNFSGKSRELKAETGEMEASQLLPERKGKKADFTLQIQCYLAGEHYQSGNRGTEVIFKSDGAYGYSGSFLRRPDPSRRNRSWKADV